jgi:biotin carboxylase
LFKQFARKYGIQTPQAVYFDNEEKALNWLSQAEYPIIVKPIDLTGGKGVSRADNHTQAVESVKYAFQKSRANHIVIEPFIEGTQHAMCTFLVNQKVVAVGSNNEYSLFDDPYKVEIATFPADYINEMQQCLVAQVEKMAEVLHLKDGIFHMQYIVRDGKPYIIECMRRVLGNMYGIPCSKLNGFDWYLWQSKVYCGYSMDTFPKDVAQSGYWASRPVYPKADGTFKQLHIPADFERFIFKRVDLQQPGYVITDYHQEILSLLFMRFDSNDEMHHILVDRYEDIRVEVE